MSTPLRRLPATMRTAIETIEEATRATAAAIRNVIRRQDSARTSVAQIILFHQHAAEAIRQRRCAAALEYLQSAAALTERLTADLDGAAMDTLRAAADAEQVEKRKQAESERKVRQEDEKKKRDEIIKAAAAKLAAKQAIEIDEVVDPAE